MDLGHNFELAHATCNGNKSDRLAAAGHLDTWVERQERDAEMLASEFNRHEIVNDQASSARIDNWAYTNTFECHGLTWVRGDELRELETG